MTEEQMIHIGMVNSFNVITKKYTFDEIIQSDMSLFAHTPDADVHYNLIQMMIDYFQAYDMYEYCQELVTYRDENFYEDGTSKEVLCKCSQPLIVEYSKKMHCGICDKRLKR